MVVDGKKFVGFKTCSKQHILGQMRQNEAGAEIFELFRQAIDYGEDMPEAVDVIAVIIGKAQRIRCSICGETISWNEAKPRRFAVHAAFE